MTKRQQDFFAMALKVRNFYTKNQVAMGAVPVLSTYFGQLNGMIDALLDAHTGSRADLRGVAVHKMQKRKELQSLAHRISGAVSVYGVVNSDAVLQKRAAVSSSFWQNCNSKTLVTHATIIKNLALPLSGALAPYGVVAADITDLDSRIDAFVNVIFSPALALRNRMDETRKVAESIEEIRTFFKEKLDLVMRTMEVADKGVYDLYFLARAIDR